MKYAFRFLSFVILSFLFICNISYSEELPPLVEKNVENKFPVTILKLTAKNFESRIIPAEARTRMTEGGEDDLDIFKEPLWIEGKLNPLYKKWYSSKLHNLIQYINLYAGRNLFLIMPTTTADNLSQGTDRIRVGGNFSTVFMRETEGQFDAQFDYEVLEGYVIFNYGLTDDIEAGIYARGFHYSAGRMDSFKNTFEKAVTGSDGGRGKFPNNQYAQTLTVDGKKVFDAKKNEFQAGDLITTLKFKVLEETPASPAVAILTAVKLPTGDEDAGFGSGTLDGGVSFVFTKHFTKQLRAHLNLGVAQPGGNGSFPETTTVYSFIPAIEYAFNTRWQAAFQVNLSTSPFDNIPFAGIGESSFNIGVALTRNMDSGNQWHLYFMDELDNSGDPDYVVGWAYDVWPLLGKKAIKKTD